MLESAFIGAPLSLWSAWKTTGFLWVTDVVGYISIAVLLLYSAWQYRVARKGLLPLPPCPPKQGALGHVAILPESFEYLAYGKWAKELNSDIIHVQLGKKILVVLNSWEAINEVLERNSANYSDRHQDTMKSKIVGWGWLLSSMPYGERWRKGRALFQQHLHPQNFRLFQPRQLAFIHGLLLPQLLEGPTDIRAMMKCFSGGLSISVAYGIEMQAKNDPYLALFEDAITSLVQSSLPGRWLVDIFPILRFVPSWFPGAEWKRQGLIYRQTQIDTRNKAFDAGMQAIGNGTAKPSFLLESIQAYGDVGPNSEEMELIKDVSGIIFGGGAETIASVINGVIVAMLCYPEVQEKARQELDRAIGVNRLPTYEDKPKLPYITAVIQEGLRWQTPNPIALPHKSSEEGSYKGYRIPKGASVIGNVWGLMHDERDYPDPFSFKPERWLNPDGSLNETVRNPSSAVFGFGRRMCPGRHIGLSVLWMSIASILATFVIEKGIDDNGNTIEPEPKFVSGIARSPAPFKATFRVRSKEMEDLVRNLEESHL